MSALTVPFWFKQRQCKAEPAGDEHTLKVAGPNLSDAYLRIRQEGERWRAEFRLSPDGPVVVATEAELSLARLRVPDLRLILDILQCDEELFSVRTPDHASRLFQDVVKLEPTPAFEFRQQRLGREPRFQRKSRPRL